MCAGARYGESQCLALWGFTHVTCDGSNASVKPFQWCAVASYANNIIIMEAMLVKC